MDSAQHPNDGNGIALKIRTPLQIIIDVIGAESKEHITLFFVSLEIVRILLACNEPAMLLNAAKQLL